MTVHGVSGIGYPRSISVGGGGPAASQTLDHNGRVPGNAGWRRLYGIGPVVGIARHVGRNVLSRPKIFPVQVISRSELTSSTIIARFKDRNVGVAKYERN